MNPDCSKGPRAAALREGEAHLKRSLRDRVTGKQMRTGAAALADQVVCSATNFLTGIIVGRACSKEEFGAYSLGLSIVLLMGAIQAGLILTPYMICVPRLRGDARDRYTGSILVHEAVLCVLAAVFLALLAGFLHGTTSGELVPVAATMAAVVTFLLFREHARQVCFARLRMGAALALDCGVGVVQIAILALLAYYGVLSAAWACWSLGAASLLAMSVWVFWGRGRLVLRPAEILPDLASNWSFGKWVFCGSMVWALVTYLSPWILMQFHGTASAGIWAVCVGVVSFVSPLVVGLQNLFGPGIAHACVESDRRAFRWYVWKAAATSALCLAPVVLMLLIFGGWLASLIYGEKYADNHWVIAGLSTSVFLGAFDFSFSRALYALRRADWDFLANLSGIVVFGLVGVWLMRVFGPMGTALGLMMYSATTITVRLSIFTWLLRREARQTNPEAALVSAQELPCTVALEESASTP